MIFSRLCCVYVCTCNQSDYCANISVYEFCMQFCGSLSETETMLFYSIPEGKSALSMGVLSSTGWTLLASVKWAIKQVVVSHRKTMFQVQKSICLLCHFLSWAASSRWWGLTSEPCCAITVMIVDVRERVGESVWNHSRGLFKYS